MSNPKQIKQQITALKQTLSSIQSTSSDDIAYNINYTYKILLLIELCQRGKVITLPTYNNKYDSKDSATTLLESIIDTCGKISLFDAHQNNTTTIPKPLLTGVHAMGGMVIEKLLELLNQINDKDDVSSTILESSLGKDEKYKEALNRSKEVNDMKFYILLNLSNVQQSTKTNSLGIIKERCVLLGRSYYLQAGYVTPDQPIMWKRCLDLSLQFNNNSMYTILPLSKLLNIAVSKSNTKKVYEFYLKIISSHLSAAQNVTIFQINNRSYDSILLLNEDITLFDKMNSATFVFKTTKDLFDKCSSLHSQEEVDQDCLLYYKTKLEILLLQEKVFIREKEDDFVKSKQSLSSTVKSKAAAIATIRMEIASKLKENDNEVNTSFGLLLFYILSSSDYDIGAMNNLVLTYLQRLFIIVTSSLSTDNVDENIILSHVISILILSFKDKERNVEIIQLSYISILMILWKGLVGRSYLFLNVDGLKSIIISYFSTLLQEDESNVESIISSLLDEAFDMITILHHCVTILQETMITSQQQLNDKSDDGNSNSCYSIALNDNIGNIFDNTSEIRSCLLQTGYYYMQIYYHNHEEEKNRFKEIISKYDKVQPSTKYDELFGTSYLSFICTWGGIFYNSKHPWNTNLSSSSLTIHQVDDIISNARNCITSLDDSISKKMKLLCDLSDGDKILSLQIKRYYNNPMLSCKYLIQIKDIYSTTLQQVQEEQNDPLFYSLIRIYCYYQLCNIDLELNDNYHQILQCKKGTLTNDEMNDITSNDYIQGAEEHVRLGLNILSQDNNSATSIVSFFWNNTQEQYPQLQNNYSSYGHKLLADTLLQQYKHNKAKITVTEITNLYKKAIQDTNDDYDMNLSLCSFLLQSYLANPNIETKEVQKALISCAKSNPKSDIFALLGVWYKLVMDDKKRCEGCFAKALLLDPCSPLAGRGYVSLFDIDNVIPDSVIIACEKATSIINHTKNGWAWKVLGIYNQKQTNYEYAIHCYQHALRCQDIEYPTTIDFYTFFNLLETTTNDYSRNNEMSYTWTLLADCYYLLGKYSASLRAYNNANDTLYNTSSSDKEQLPSFVLCSWGQVSLELGLFVDAYDKFNQVLVSKDKDSYHPIAAYGKATCLLHLSRYDIDQGKYNLAIKHLIEGEEVLMHHLVKVDDEIYKSKYTCALKLLGEIYTSSAILAPNAFVCFLKDDDVQDQQQLLFVKLEFVSKGENAYQAMYQMLKKRQQDDGNKTNDSDLSKDHLHTRLAHAAYDLACNQFIQSAISIEILSLNTNTNDLKEKQRYLLEQSIKYFQLSIDIDHDNTMTASWCGLSSCHFLNNDMLLAQHCLCHCIQMDKTLPDAWTNLALLYIHNQPNNPKLMDDVNKALETLTQIADIPFIWIGRGMLLEMKMEVENENERYNKAATDAYRAALQVSRHPLALLGLSACASRSRACSCNNPNKDSRESCDSMIMYLHATGGGYNTTFDHFISSVMLLEDELQKYIYMYASSTQNDKNLLLKNDRITINDIPKWILEECSSIKCKENEEISLMKLISSCNTKGDQVDDTVCDDQDVSNPNNNNDKNWEYWFDLTKDLIQKATLNVEETPNEVENTEISLLLQDAIEAANKAYKILLKEQKELDITNDNYLKSLSDILSLLFWLHHEVMVEDDNFGDTKLSNELISTTTNDIVDGEGDNDENKNNDDDVVNTTKHNKNDGDNFGDVECVTFMTAIDYLQKALIYHPENQLGQAGLQKLVNS